jgi:hypothetical protein
MWRAVSVRAWWISTAWGRQTLKVAFGGVGWALSDDDALAEGERCVAVFGVRETPRILFVALVSFF